ncbi:alkaline shock response membrane anchor protein AmaP [Fusobacterium mortiferum]|uniref:alkaline shock response membrane anchor protein AmaP n=1 Tax=Fusobacterium mortiferum TaxID=850 RepID=UPI0022E72091|nr:alkaline shock response membrane anchor protein AmaP [Fusobacterium mortiferum]
MIKKIIFFFAWLGIFLLSITGIVYVAVPKYLVQFNTYIGTLSYDIVVLAISIIYFIISILKFLSLFERTKDYEIKTEDGVVYISSASVTSFIRELLSKDKEISNIRVETSKKGRKFNIRVRLDMLSNGNISGKSSSIQNEIKSKLADKMGLEVGAIEVKISKLAVKDTNSQAEE